MPSKFVLVVCVPKNAVYTLGLWETPIFQCGSRNPEKILAYSSVLVSVESVLEYRVCHMYKSE